MYRLVLMRIWSSQNRQMSRLLITQVSTLVYESCLLISFAYISTSKLGVI